MIDIYKILYFLTIYFPVKSRVAVVYGLARLIGRERAIQLTYKLTKKLTALGFLPDGNIVFYPLDDLKIVNIINEIYFSEIYDFGKGQDFRLVVDVGAHIGLFALKMVKRNKEVKVIAVEANPSNYDILLKNIAVNKLSRISAFNIAAGATKGKLPFYLSMVSRGNGTLKRNHHNAGSAGTINVDVYPLNQFLPIREIDLIKIDVEGAELEILHGCAGLKISNLVMEVHNEIVDVTEIYRWLHNHGFVIIKTQKLYEDCLLLKARRR